VIEACLDSIAAGAGRLAVEVIVVDNASTDATRDLAAKRPDVQLVAQDANLGFAAAANVGLGIARGPALLLLNPDTAATPGAFERLVGALGRFPDVGLVAPTLASPTEATTRPPLAAWPTLGRMFRHHTPLKHVCRPRRWTPVADTPTTDGYLTGACLLIRRRTLEQVGPLDERYFFYLEDVEYARRAVLNGWRVLWVRDAVVYHRGGEGGGRFDAAWRHWQFLRGARRYFGPSGGPAFVATWTLFKLLHLLDLVVIATESGLKRPVYGALGRRAHADKHRRRWTLAAGFLGRFAWRFARW
jgi:GT2 family glycosyltransferase